MILEFAQFLRIKEVEARRTITLAEISRGSGVSEDTIRRLIKGRITRIDKNTISGLCHFFNVPAGPVPFIIYRGRGGGTDDQTP